MEKYQDNIKITDGTNDADVVQNTDEDVDLDNKYGVVTSGIMYARVNGEVRPIKMDESTHALMNLSYSHHEIHVGSSFSVNICDADFDKSSEIGILFTTPNTTKWIHMIAFVSVATKALFEILEAPTIDTGNYPTTFSTPINRNRNSANASVVSSVRATPQANQVSLKEKADVTPISADGTVIHCESFGGKKGVGISPGVGDTDEYVLKQNTTYYFRLKGDGTGTDDVAASMKLVWYEHTDIS